LRFKKLNLWESGKENPTLKQLESFAKAVHVPFGYLFLQSPPAELLPIQDFRTFDNKPVLRPSPNLLDTIYACQERQAWYKEFAMMTRQPPCDYVGSVGINMSVEKVAEDIRNIIGFDLDIRRTCATWTEALRLFIQQADRVGILVMVSGIVMNNTKRKLDPYEFRGFTLSDPLAPLVFINGSDTKAAQMFTLAHELAHLWLNASGISNAGPAPLNGFQREEVWCNAVAAEFLVPLSIFTAELHRKESIEDAINRLARHFKVSTLVILRRLLDAGWFSRTDFEFAWKRERERLRQISISKGGGGEFYNTAIARVGRRFTRALSMSTLEGQTLYRDAMRMLGIKQTETFHNLCHVVGVRL
jgi:Zn-dependent peptidase ImmA (M78 family)